MNSFDSFPIDPRQLHKHVLQAARRMRSSDAGQHVRRRPGLSLEFREFRDYVPGDDYRHIDWRASARVGGPNDLIVRSFHVEERLNLAISVDTRRDTDLPAALPKARVGLWLARALMTIALRGGDTVTLHRLYGDPGSVHKPVGRSLASMRRFFDECDEKPAAERLNYAELDRYLPTASIWVVITDLYGHDVPELARYIARKQHGYRWIVVVETDSWPMESLQLIGAPTRVIGNRVDRSQNLDVELDANSATQVEERIDARRREFLHDANAGSLEHSHWVWPEAVDDIGEWFIGQFAADRPLRYLMPGGRA